jgi:hypothetical protein
LFGLAGFEFGGAGMQLLFPTSELAAPLVEFRVAAVEGGVAVVEAFLKASELGATGPDLCLGLVFELESGLLGSELGLAPGIFSGTASVLDDGAGVGTSLGLPCRHPKLAVKVADDEAQR